MFGVFGRFRRNSKQLDQSNDDSLGDTIPTKYQFFMEFPVKGKLEQVESLLLSFGAKTLSEEIRSASTVSSLSSNSASTYDLPRREKSLKGEDSMLDTSRQRKTTLPPPACCVAVPMFLEEETPPLKIDQQSPTLFRALFSCCSPDTLDTEPTYSVAPTAGFSDKSLFGFSDTDGEGEGEEVSNKVAKKNGGLRAWRQRSTKRQEVF
jgi:hypothetical protein